MKNIPFTLAPEFTQDSHKIRDLKLCELRLKADGDLDWFILIPKRANLVEMIDLNAEDLQLFHDDLRLVCETLKRFKNPYKLNVANLGNIVRQLHIHVIGRNPSDRAWPNPVWGTKSIQDFDPKTLDFWTKCFLSN